MRCNNLQFFLQKMSMRCTDKYNILSKTAFESSHTLLKSVLLNEEKSNIQ